ncbi:MAG: MBL fold metallo-hydrolase [Acetobacteraceae bacterium]|nr:MBL fold metallo-hydrolase [Acetobacteraceae bacterium]
MATLQIAVIPVTIFQQNCAIVWDKDTRDCMVVDPGGEPGRIVDALNRFDLQPQMLLLTHGHLDHAGGAKALKGLIDENRLKQGLAPAPLVGPDQRDTFLLDNIESQALAYGMTGLRNAQPDRFLTEGEVISLGGLRFDVLHCPGHTPGHLVFVEKTARFALVGDVLFRGSVGRTDFPYGSHEQLLESIETKLLPLGDDVQFLCGHGEGSSIGVERQTNPFLKDMA